MAADGNHASGFEHDGAVGLQHRCQPMSDDECGAILHQPPEGQLHQTLGLGIECAGGLIEQQDRRILEDCARDGDALALPARQPRAALTEEGVVAGG